MQRLTTVLLLSVLFLPALGETGSAQQVRSERLLGGNENPPVVSDGSGSFRARLRHDRISFRLRYEDLASADSEVLQAHLHIANPGNNGGIAAFLCSNLEDAPTDRTCPPSQGDVTGDIFAEDVREVIEGTTVILGAGDLEGLKRLIDQGSVYANVHTDAHTGGEIRGQLEPRRR